MTNLELNRVKGITQRLLVFCFLGWAVIAFQGCTNSYISIQEPKLKDRREECVVLLHGMGRSYSSMSAMQNSLTMSGYHTVNIGYPSTRKTIEAIVDASYPVALEKCEQYSPTTVHFVTHSLGGIILRKALTGNKPAKLGRVVMLSPPNRGSEIVDAIKDWWLFRWLMGPAGQQLSTREDSVPNQLGAVDYPVGVIAGNKHAFFDHLFAKIIPGLDDGKVSVERARVAGMSDFLIVNESHPYIMESRYVQFETGYFLQHGCFKHVKEPIASASGSDWYSK